MGRIQKLIEENTGSYVHSLMIGNSIEADELNGFFMNINEQVRARMHIRGKIY